MPLDGDLTPADLDATMVSGGQGPAGATGATGPAGHTPVFSIDTVVTGSPAAVTAGTSEEGDVTLSFVIPAGATGATGAAGATGATGATGAAGSTGATGAAGATGAQGPGHGWPNRVNTIYIPPRNLLYPDGALSGATASMIYLNLFDVSAAATLNKFRTFAYANAVLSGKFMKFVAYSVGTNGWPADNLYTSSAITLSNSSSAYSVTGLSVALSAGQVWAGVVFDSTVGASSFFASFLNANYGRSGGVTDDPTDTGSGIWDGVGYADSYSSPRATALDTNVSRVRKQLTANPVVWLALT